jgi:hypothetical protein
VNGPSIITAALLLVLGHLPGAYAEVLLDDVQLDQVAAGGLQGSATAGAWASSQGGGNQAITTLTSTNVDAYSDGVRQWVTSSSGARASAWSQ